MTKRRPKNKKPTGLNRFLGNCLLNEREKLRQQYRKRQQAYNTENMVEVDKNVAQNVDSVIEETGLEEFLAFFKFSCIFFIFSSHRNISFKSYLILRENSKVVVNTINAAHSMDELYRKYGDRLRIPRRPPKEACETVDDLMRLENEYFLEWRKNLADLQENNGVLLTPFERNLELWRQLWRVIERSDIVVQILDARNPLLFRNLDLEAYIKECDIAKQSIYLINKIDLLSKEQMESWRNWFMENDVDAVFWSALEPEANCSGVMEKSKHNESGDGSEKKVENRDQDSDGSSSGVNGDDDDGKHSHSCRARLSQNIDVSEQKIPIIHCAAELILFFKSRAHIIERRPFVVGMVGYPNVGKSSTINKLMDRKKVSVSATPGKTRHLQTLVVDEELTLCDCPGLVMPSFALSRSEMILNGILSIDHMHEYLSPVELLLTRIPRRYFEKIYSIMLTSTADNDSNEESLLSAHDLLTAVAFIRGYMSSSGVADCSRAARLILKDVVNGKVKWVAAPPDVDQKEFDKLTYDVLNEASSVKPKLNSGIMQQLEKRHLLQDMKPSDKLLDEQFFLVQTVSAGYTLLAPMFLNAFRFPPKLSNEIIQVLWANGFVEGCGVNIPAIKALLLILASSSLNMPFGIVKMKM
ncbi:60S ribosomal protein L27 [Wuchereria bancrofti]|uniref:Large subunit GTPase 1 homolog n=1 Tax=Wuchereria bancrofti TaxID=6293 RepID=J9F098_WUCBA|nr:60S ribosomal protein L27 [Wuchereria bancrofti]